MGLWTPRAYAAGTAAGTTITNRASGVWRTGAATAETATTPVVGGSDTLVVAAYGETLTDAADTVFGVGETAVFLYRITNNGNAADSYRVWIDDTTYAGGATGWRTRLFVGAASTGLEDDTLTTADVAAGADVACSVQVVSSAGGSPSGASESFTLVVRSVRDPAASSYVGDNGVAYAAGGGERSDTARARIAALASFRVTANTTAIRAGETVVLTLVALDGAGDTLVSFVDTAAVSASTGTASPAATGLFAAGIRTETVTVTGAGDSLILTVASGAVSNTFALTVRPGAPVRFTCSAPATATAGTAFSLTMTALDTYGNVATSYADTARISDSTGSIAPAATGNFTAGVWTGNVTVATARTSDSIVVETGALRGEARTTVTAGVTSGRLVEAWVLPASGSASEIVVRVVNESGVPLGTTGDTVRITILGAPAAYVNPNPYETTTVGGVARIPYASLAPADVQSVLKITLVGETAGVTYDDFRLEVDPADPVRTVAEPDGAMVQVPLSLMPDSWRVIIRPIVQEDRSQITTATGRLPASLLPPGAETEIAREVYAVRTDGSRVSGALGGQVIVYLRYPDADRNGIVDGYGISAATLRVYRLNEADGVWEVFPNAGLGIDSGVKAIVEHFSFFLLLGQRDARGLEATITYPNPFYPLEAGRTAGGVAQTGYVTIDTRRANHAWMRVTVYNLTGEVVRRIENATAAVGQVGVDRVSGLAYWDGRNDAGRTVASGLYFFVVETDQGQGVGKMTVIK